MPPPRRLNFVTLALLAGLAAGSYWLWKFFPVYYTSWQVDHLLSEAVAETYQIARLPDAARATAKDKIERDTRSKIAELGVTDPDLTLHIIIDSQTATANCDYVAYVQHAVISKRVLIRLHRSAKTDIKKVQW